jgi:hypothetical protein
MQPLVDQGGFSWMPLVQLANTSTLEALKAGNTPILSATFWKKGFDQSFPGVLSPIFTGTQPGATAQKLIMVTVGRITGVSDIGMTWE